MAGGPLVRVLRLSGMPILQQLRLEEALLRTDAGNWFLLNDGTPEPAVVMGISGKPERLVDIPALKAAGIPLIKRFSGGGTVVVDRDTIFATLIMEGASLPEVECYPRPIMAWTERFYGTVFGPHGDFSLRGHDYIFGDRKFGGNAQAITRRRWLHHTSFLWDFRDDRMALLQHPEKAPEYRAGRDHLEFVCRLKDVLPGRARLLQDILAALPTAGFQVQARAVNSVRAQVSAANLSLGTAQRILAGN